MKTAIYDIEGMHCGSCEARVKSALETIGSVTMADISLKDNSATLSLSENVDIENLQKALKEIGTYTISKKDITDSGTDWAEPSITTYQPLILIIGFIAGVTFFSQYPFDNFDAMLWMRHFMAGFFIVFSFFKLLNLDGFRDSYRMYDIVASKWSAWGYIYPFVELILGLAYLINFNPGLTNWATIIILSVSSIGVIESNINKRKIKCACLGDVFNLPMSTVTIVEDIGMVFMAILMLLF